MKYEWKKEEKKVYAPKAQPTLINVPKARYICIKGTGNPNKEEFANRVSVLYSLSYAIRMMPKKGHTPTGYFEYTVYPLEGLWDLNEEGRKKASLDKEDFVYTIMIKQPDFVDEKVFLMALDFVRAKDSNPLLNEAYLQDIEDGLSVQMLHVGSYDSEPCSFDKMKRYIADNNLVIKTLVHREIYLSDARKVTSDKLKTILRYVVEKN